MFSNELWHGKAASSYAIDQSIRFNDADNAYLARTFSTPTNNKKWTLSAWVKLGVLGTNRALISSNINGAEYFDLFFTTANVLKAQNRIGSSNDLLSSTTRVFRDPSGFYHFTIVYDSDNSTSADRYIVYVNGDRQTVDDEAGSGVASAFNKSGVQHQIGISNTLGSSGVAGLGYQFDGYMSEIHFVDGQALAPTQFGETSENGIWIPKKYDGSYGNNGFKIDGRDSSDLGNDEAGSNDFTTSGLAAHDQVLDTPTNNFAVYNILYNVGDVDFPTYSEGNLSVDFNYFGKRSPVSTFALPTDSDAYCEFYIKTSASSAHNSGVGIGQGDANNTGNVALTNGVTYNFNGYKHTGDGTATTFGNTYTAGDIIGVYFDQSDNEVDFYKNNTLEGSLSLSSYSGDLFFLVANNTTNQQVIIANFGQDDTFAGNKTSGSAGASDSSGNGKFYYSRISGAKALCSKSLGS